MRKRLWSPDEDEKLKQYILKHGHQIWSEVPEKTGLQRCGKSCRLRWINYLRPGLRRSKLSKEEKNLVMELHEVYGNRWTKIASHLDGRTDNDVKNVWNSQMKIHVSKLNNTKQMLPNAFVHSSKMSSSSTKLKTKECGLISYNNEILMQPKPRPNIFPFILDSNNEIDGLIDEKHPFPLEHIGKLELSNINEMPIYSLGVDINSSLGYSKIAGNSSTLLNTNTSLIELETNQESTIFHISMENLINMSNYSYDSLGAITNHNQDKDDEYFNHVFPWFNQHHTNEILGPNEKLEKVVDEGTSFSQRTNNHILDHNVKSPTLFNAPFVSPMNLIDIHDDALSLPYNEDMHTILQAIC